MKYDLILVRYGEIALKSSYVRNKFESILISNIKKAFNDKKIDCNIDKEWGRIYIYTNKITSAISILKKIFGIISFSPAVKTKSNISKISKKSLSFIKKNIKSEKSFAIRSNRAGNHDFSSKDVSIKVGSDIVNALNLNVDLTNPDFELYIDTRQNYCYIFKKKYKGIGGMPVGSQNKLLCIVRSKKSILSSFYLLKRGCKVLYYIDENFNKKTVEDFLKNWFIEKNYLFYESNDLFYKKLNSVIKKEKCKAVISDLYKKEHISKMKEINKEIKTPILYPLIAMDDKQINKKLKKIGL